MLDALRQEFRRYRRLVEKTLDQVPDDALDRVPTPDGNSIGMLVRHLTGNLVSRFTDFLTTDGEKPWRHRDREFEERGYSRAEVDTMWERAWEVLDGTLDGLEETDLERRVTIRGKELTVTEALARSVAHLAYHAGQIVLLARMDRGPEWRSLSIPKGGSEAYNADPTREKPSG